MKASIRIALLFVLIWFTGKYSFFYFGILQSSEEYFFLVMWNILCLLLAMLVGSYFEKKNEDRSTSSALGDIKSIMGGGMIYTISVSLLLYVYYAKVDPDYNAHQIEVVERGLTNSFKDPEYVKAQRASNPAFKSMTEDEMFDALMENPKVMFSAKSAMLISLLGLLLLSVINAIVLTFVFRRLIFRS